MNILGLSGGIKIGNQDGAAALLVDGQLVAAAEEERFLGIKFANGQLPRNAIAFCLAQAGLAVEDLDAVVFAGATYERFEEILVMDSDNLERTLALQPADSRARVSRLLNYAGQLDEDVPDPYYSGDFDGTLDLIVRAVRGLCQSLDEGLDQGPDQSLR